MLLLHIDPSSNRFLMCFCFCFLLLLLLFVIIAIFYLPCVDVFTEWSVKPVIVKFNDNTTENNLEKNME